MPPQFNIDDFERLSKVGEGNRDFLEKRESLKYLF
jgi:hypothetical protein